LIKERRAGGIATQLDVARAQAEVERSKQNMADAELLASLTQRALLTITGVAASGGMPGALDDLREEAPLSEWEGKPADMIPALEMANLQVKIAATGERAAKFSMAPSLSLTAVERLTNATGFLLGNWNAYSFVFTLSFKLDVSEIAQIKAAAQQAE